MLSFDGMPGVSGPGREFVTRHIDTGAVRIKSSAWQKAYTRSDCSHSKLRDCCSPQRKPRGERNIRRSAQERPASIIRSPVPGVFAKQSLRSKFQVVFHMMDVHAIVHRRRPLVERLGMKNEGPTVSPRPTKIKYGVPAMPGPKLVFQKYSVYPALTS